ncbi:unannotated protein [freshwater metagenome]|uniref:ATP:glycerol 3-phosphotransferase n=1 Tax=freshwater metagenome TaxID=449393 RepID=A0A6J7T2K2_9ZZZZ|nr:glycerol kinase [Actinomycetota bacterium]MTB25047.1 glycerol kinase [Actinomycetota bacterium]
MILSVDAGTTGITVLVIDRDRNVVGRGYQEFPQHFPEPGWVEHDPNEIWSAVLAAASVAIDGIDKSKIEGVGITNQRETLVLWDRETLGAPRRAIVWQDRRTTSICERFKDVDVSNTGLRMDPYFTGTKALWIAENEPRTWRYVEDGRIALGTIDSYLIARMSRGLDHVTDATNASRTLMYDLSTGDWDDRLLDLFHVPREALPMITSSWGDLAHTEPTAFLGLDVPITGIAGDQQSALISIAGFDPGSAACAYGTGSFLLVNTGKAIPSTASGTLATVAWQAPDGARAFASEGGVFVTGAAVQWFRDGLGAIKSSAEIEELARTVKSSEGVILVPALAGLGAPLWNPHARGAILGLSLASTMAHMARALLEGIAHSITDVVESMQVELTKFGAHGGASQNDLLCQMQSTLLNSPVYRRHDLEATALGAADLAARGLGWPDRDGVTTEEALVGPVEISTRESWKEALATVGEFAEGVR